MIGTARQHDRAISRTFHPFLQRTPQQGGILICLGIAVQILWSCSFVNPWNGNARGEVHQGDREKSIQISAKHSKAAGSDARDKFP